MAQFPLPQILKSDLEIKIQVFYNRISIEKALVNPHGKDSQA